MHASGNTPRPPGAPPFRRRRFQAWVALLAVMWADPVSSAAIAPEPDVLRVAVGYVPPEPGATDIRLYTPEGFDVFLAGRLAERLERRLELVELPREAGAAALERGEVDLVLARIGDGDPLARRARAIPTGFRSGASLAMRTDTDILAWENLAGRIVCVSAANAHGQAVAAAHGARLRIEDAPARALMLVRTGVCDAAIHDAVLLERLFGESDWDKFSATLPAVAPTELAALVEPDDRALAEGVAAALSQMADAGEWAALSARWARNVAFEVYLDQDAPDCH